MALKVDSKYNMNEISIEIDQFQAFPTYSFRLNRLRSLFAARTTHLAEKFVANHKGES